MLVIVIPLAVIHTVLAEKVLQSLLPVDHPLINNLSPAVMFIVIFAPEPPETAPLEKLTALLAIFKVST